MQDGNFHDVEHTWKQSLEGAITNRIVLLAPKYDLIATT